MVNEGRGKWGRGVVCPLIFWFSSVQTSPSCFLFPPPDTFQGWLSITLTFFFAYSVTTQLLFTHVSHILLSPSPAVRALACHHYTFSVFSQPFSFCWFGFYWIYFPPTAISPFYFFCVVFAELPIQPPKGLQWGTQEIACWDCIFILPLSGNSRFGPVWLIVMMMEKFVRLCFYCSLLFWEVWRVKFTYPPLAQLFFYFLRYWHKKNEE